MSNSPPLPPIRIETPEFIHRHEHAWTSVIAKYKRLSGDARSELVLLHELIALIEVYGIVLASFAISPPQERIVGYMGLLLIEPHELEVRQWFEDPARCDVRLLSQEFLRAVRDIAEPIQATKMSYPVRKTDGTGRVPGRLHHALIRLGFDVPATIYSMPIPLDKHESLPV